jgi:hypothetical protein
MGVAATNRPADERTFSEESIPKIGNLGSDCVKQIQRLRFEDCEREGRI